MKKLYETLNRMSIYVRRAWDAKMPVGWEIPPRYIYDYELLYIKEGRLRIEIEEFVYEGNPGDLFLFCPGQKHSIKSEGSVGVHQPHIHFDFYFDEYSEKLDIPLEMPNGDAHMRKDIGLDDPLLRVPSKMTFKNPYDIEELIFAIISEEGNNNPFRTLRIKSLMFDLLYRVFNYKNVDKGSYGKDNALSIVQRANAFMQKNYNRNLTSEEIAREVGYSTSYFVAMYRNVCMMTPVKYHEKLRVERAKNLFRSTHLTVSEVSEELGFKSLYDFSRFFKRSTGKSPTHFRAEREDIKIESENNKEDHHE